MHGIGMGIGTAIGISISRKAGGRKTGDDLRSRTSLEVLPAVSGLIDQLTPQRPKRSA